MEDRSVYSINNCHIKKNHVVPCPMTYIIQLSAYGISLVCNTHVLHPVPASPGPMEPVGTGSICSPDRAP